MPPALWEYFELENFLFILLLPKKKKKVRVRYKFKQSPRVRNQLTIILRNVSLYHAIVAIVIIIMRALSDWTIVVRRFIGSCEVFISSLDNWQGVSDQKKKKQEKKKKTHFQTVTKTGKWTAPELERA